jgi:hypothetical protein
MHRDDRHANRFRRAQDGRRNFGRRRIRRPRPRHRRMRVGCGWRRRHLQRLLGLRYSLGHCDWRRRPLLLRLELPCSWANCDSMRQRLQRLPGHPSNSASYDSKPRLPRLRLRHRWLGVGDDCGRQHRQQRLLYHWPGDFCFVSHHARRLRLPHSIHCVRRQILPVHHRMIVGLGVRPVSLRTNCRREAFRRLVVHRLIVRPLICHRRRHEARHRLRIT